MTDAAFKCYQLSTSPAIGRDLLDAPRLLIATAEFEFLLGIWLAANVFLKQAWAAALACFGTFTCVSFHRALSGYANCGCFGPVQVDPWFTTALGLAVTVSLLRSRPKGQGAVFAFQFARPPRRAVLVLVVWIAIGIPSALVMGRYTDVVVSDAGEIIGNGKIVVLKPDAWIGKRFPLLEHIDIGDELSSGLWLVLLHRHNCTACREAVSQYETLATEFCTKLGCPTIALVECPPYAERMIRAADAPWVRGRLTGFNEWQLSGPAGVLIDAGQVRSVFTDARDVELVRAIWLR